MPQLIEGLLRRIEHLPKSPLHLDDESVGFITGQAGSEKVPHLKVRYIIVPTTVEKLHSIVAMVVNSDFGTFMREESHQWGVGTLFSEHFFSPRPLRPIWFGTHGELMEGRSSVLNYYPHIEFDGELAQDSDALFFDLHPITTPRARRTRTKLAL